MTMLDNPAIADAWPIALAIAAAASLASVFVVAHRLAFLVVGVSHASLAGAGWAALVGWPLLPVAGVVAAALAALLALAPRARLGEDAAAGMLFSGGMAIGVLLLSASNAQADVFGLLFGDVLAVAPDDRRWLAFGLALMLGGVALGARAWWLLAADPIAAEAAGWPTTAWRVAMHLLLGLAVMLCVKLAGVVLTAGLLVLPATIAWPWARGLGSLILGAIMAGSAGAWAGLWLAWRFDWPAGAATVVALLTLWSASAGLAGLVRRIRAI